MNNSIILYKSEYTPSSPRQPYFRSIDGRNNYLNSIEHIELALVQPNIVIGANLNINIVAPIDISQIEEYTLAKILYNEKEYFIYIVDIAMVSLNNTRLFGHRSIAFECVDYLSKFEKFDINKITTDELFFGTDTRFQLPVLKLLQNSESALPYLSNSHMPESINMNDKYYTKNGVRHCLFAVVCVSTSVSEAGSEFSFVTSGLDGLSSEFANLLVPLIDYTMGNEKQNFKVCYNTLMQGNKFGRTNSNYFVNRFLEKISPYIYNLAYIRLPVFSYINGTNEIVMLPYDMRYYSYAYKIGESNSEIVEFGAIGTRKWYSYDYELSTNVNLKYMYGKFTVQLYGEHNINLDLNRYIIKNSNGYSIPIKFRIKYVFDTHGVNIQLESELPDSDFKRIENYKEQYVYKISAGATFFVSAKEDWLAQNKYYDAVTGNESSYIKIKGGLGSASSITTGLYQTSLGAGEMGLSGGKAGWGGISNGGSNIIRGIYQGIETVFDESHYSMQRFYNALNEQHKPDTEKDSVENGYVLTSIKLPVIRFIYSEPFPTDLANFTKRAKVYGIECNIFCSNYDELKEYFTEDFSISMNMYQGENNHYSNQQNNEIKELTRSGLLYKIYN